MLSEVHIQQRNTDQVDQDRPLPSKAAHRACDGTCLPRPVVSGVPSANSQVRWFKNLLVVLVVLCSLLAVFVWWQLLHTAV